MTQAVKKGGSYGSTQATILALKALTKYLKNFVALSGKGEYVVSLNGEDVLTQPFDDDTKDTIKFDLSDYIASNPELFEPGDQLNFTLSL